MHENIESVLVQPKKNTSTITYISFVPHHAKSSTDTFASTEPPPRLHPIPRRILEPTSPATAPLAIRRACTRGTVSAEALPVNDHLAMRSQGDALRLCRRTMLLSLTRAVFIVVIRRNLDSRRVMWGRWSWHGKLQRSKQPNRKWLSHCRLLRCLVWDSVRRLHFTLAAHE